MINLRFDRWSASPSLRITGATPRQKKAIEDRRRDFEEMLAPFDRRFEGQSFKLSGDFTFSHPKEELEMLIERFGGSMDTTVNRTTDFLVLGHFAFRDFEAGEVPTGKCAKALALREKQGTPLIIGLHQLLWMMSKNADLPCPPPDYSQDDLPPGPPELKPGQDPADLTNSLFIIVRDDDISMGGQQPE